MPRSGASAVRFDAGWDWTDSKSRADEQRDLAYYDWSLDDDFATRRPRLRAVAGDAVGERPRRRVVVDDWSRAEVDERPRIEIERRSRVEISEAPRIEIDDRPRPPRAARPARAPRLAPVAAAPAGPLQPMEPDPEPIIDAIEAPVIDPQTGRRTITITGRGAERSAVSRRPAALPTDRVRHKPDRIAMWAVLLCVLMILAAATSAHAAIIH